MADQPSTIIRGIYAITPDLLDTGHLLGITGQALRGGVRIFQYRNKQADTKLAFEQSTALRKITRASNALLIVNDDSALAIQIGADGTHLGKQDFAGMDEARKISLLKKQARAEGYESFLIGVSCYDDLARAKRAESAGAAYVAFGSVFPSKTKPAAVRASPSLIRDAKRNFSIPVVAIGGITLENAPELIAIDVDAIAVVSSLFNAADVHAQATAFTQLFANHV